MRLSPGLLESLSRRIPGVATSTVPRGDFEGGKRGSEGRLAILRTVVGGRPIQCGVLFPLCFNFHVTEKAVATLKAIWKRQISVLRKLGEIDRAVEELCKFVDTFYTDVEAWLELADIYNSRQQCASYSRRYRHSAY